MNMDMLLGGLDSSLRKGSLGGAGDMLLLNTVFAFIVERLGKSCHKMLYDLGILSSGCTHSR